MSFYMVHCCKSIHIHTSMYRYVVTRIFFFFFEETLRLFSHSLNSEYLYPLSILANVVGQQIIKGSFYSIRKYTQSARTYCA